MKPTTSSNSKTPKAKAVKNAARSKKPAKKTSAAKVATPEPAVVDEKAVTVKLEAAKPARRAKAKTKAKAISIWASPEDQELFKRVAARAKQSLSHIVRTLVHNYERSGAAEGLVTLTAAAKA